MKPNFVCGLGDGLGRDSWGRRQGIRFSGEPMRQNGAHLDLLLGLGAQPPLRAARKWFIKWGKESETNF